jgi:transketolase
VVVLEEHGLAGGAGSAVLEWGSVKRVDLNKLLCVAGPDRFLSGCGNQAEARAMLGLTVDQVVRQVRSRLAS